MSLNDLDRVQRMADYLTADKLNDEGCIKLAGEILAQAAESLAHAARRAAESLAHAARRAAECPNKDNAAHLVAARKFYESDWFRILSCGVIDGKVAAKKIIKDALKGVKVKGGEEDEEAGVGRVRRS